MILDQVSDQVHRKVFPEGHWQSASTKSLLGACLTAARRYPEAEALLLESHPVIEERFGAGHPRTRASLERVVAHYEARGDRDEADKYRRRLEPPGARPAR